MSSSATWQLLDLLHEYVVVLDADWSLHHLSSAAQDVLLFPDDAQGAPLARLIGEARSSSLFAAVVPSDFSSHGQRLVSYPLETEVGRVDLSWASFKTEGQSYLVGVGARDLDGAGAHKEQLDRLVILGQLVASVAHEITNPAAVIRGNLAIVQEAMHAILPIVDRQAAREPDLEVARLPYAFFRERIVVLLDDMRHSSERVDSLVKELRRFATREEGAPDAEVDLDEVVVRASRLVAHRATRSVELTHHRASRPPRVRGNARQLEQVVVNLLLNAVEAVEAKDVASSMPGAARIGVEVRTRWSEGEVVLEIKDEGVGISEGLRTRIFEPFFSTRGGRGGLGLGLSIVREIVEAHGAVLEVKSRPGEGTCFCLTFAGLGS